MERAVFGPLGRSADGVPSGRGLEGRSVARLDAARRRARRRPKRRWAGENYQHRSRRPHCRARAMRLPWPRREHPSRCCGATYAATPPIAKRNQTLLGGAVSREHRSSLRLKGVPLLDSGSDSDVRESKSTTRSFSPMQLQVRNQPAQISSHCADQRSATE
jgi:hypothetical protein